MNISIIDIEKGNLWKRLDLAFYYKKQKYKRSDKRIRCIECGGHYKEKYLENGLCTGCRD